ncbi:MAG TPA: hypothetical protein VK469_06880 [Candidatus Kapabacteria bacterium]|nr:hypothetical protein [Candidatus Kapabacteria bacterium]
MSRGSYFGHYKGEAIKYYAATPEGIRFFDSPGFDPKYGIELKPVTSDMMIKYQKKALGLQPKRIDNKSTENLEFFDPISGDPMIWFYVDSAGNYEFFNGPGFHPVYMVELKPINTENVKSFQSKMKTMLELNTLELRKQAEIDREQKAVTFSGRYVNHLILNSSASKDIAVIILDETDNERNDIERELTLILRSRQLNPLLGLFKQPFIRENMFSGMFAGDATKVLELRLLKHADLVFLGKITTKYWVNPELLNLVSAELNLEMKVISCENGTLKDSYKFSVTGAGFSNTAAEKKAIELLKTNIT